MPLIDLSKDLGPNTEPMVALDDDALPPGTALGGCQIVESLSSDGMSTLYLANDSALQRHVLIREHFPTGLVARGHGAQVLLEDGADPVARAAALEAFLQEARLLSRLDHPSIAKVYRFWEQNQTAYMMMPFYQGDTLTAVLQGMDEPPGEAWLRRLLASLLGALKALHATGRHHLALSPDTVWMTPEGRPMLLELSAASQVLGERTDAPDSVDRLYAPIEQFSHGAEFKPGPWTDLYAVAAVVHQALLGRPPTSAAILGTGDRLAPLAEGLLARGPRYARLEYSPGFLAALDQALSVDPRNRPQSVEEFEAALNPGPGAASAAGPSAGDAAPAGESAWQPPGPDGTAGEDGPTDPAAAAAIAMAIASLPWVGKTEPTLDRHDVSMHQVLLHEDDERPRRPSEPAPAREPVFMSLPASGGSDEAMWIEPPRTNAASDAAKRSRQAPAAERKGVRWVAALGVLVVAAGLAWYVRNPAPWGADDARPAAGSPSPQAAVQAAAPRGAEAPPAPVDVPPAAQQQQQQQLPTPTAQATTAAPADTPPATAADVAASLDKPPVAGTSSDTPPAQSRSGGGRVAEEAVVSSPPAGKAAEAGPAPTAKAPVERRPAAQARSNNGTHRAPATAAFNPEALPPTAAGPATPRATCGSRTNFALVYCMQTQCKRPGFAKHAQCVAFLRDGEVQ